MKEPKSNKSGFVPFINKLDAHHRLYIALAFAAVAFFGFNKLTFPLHLMITWLVYTLINLGLSWFTILSSHPSEVRRIAHDQDSSRTFVFIFVIMAAFSSLLAVVILLKSRADLNNQELFIHIGTSMACVISSWWLVHTVFTLRYAHYFYCNISKDKSGKHEDPGGLDFPGQEQPDYLDFTYFAFVVGMTFQVSDVQVTSKRIRRLVLIHGIVSFAFNTIIVALSINIISGLIK